MTPVVEDFESAFTLRIKGTRGDAPTPTPFNLKKAIAKCKKIKGTEQEGETQARELHKGGPQEGRDHQMQEDQQRQQAERLHQESPQTLQVIG